MRKTLIFLIFFSTFFYSKAQELKATIEVNSDKISGTNKQVFTTLKNALTQFVNQQKWSNYNFKEQEKIACNFTLTILDQSGSSFKGTLQIQSSRPVYNSSYITPVFNFKDDNIAFDYVEFQELRLNKSTFVSNLVSIMSYYCNVILGLDADTFQQNGGTPYYENAQNILVQAQQSGYKGWNQIDGNNTRFTLIDNLLSPTYSNFHTAMYLYHRKGLDTFFKDAKQGKAGIANAITELKTMYYNRPTAFLLRVFMDAKADEIVDVFSGGPYFDTTSLKDDLLKISSINANKWNQIK